MTDKQKKIWINFWEFVVYSLVGLATTIVSYGVRWSILNFFSAIYHLDLKSTSAAMVGGSSVLRWVAQTAGWVAGVLFAFLPNKVLVFRDKTWGRGHVLRQLGTFVFSRVGTYFLELLLAVALPPILQSAGYRSFMLFGENGFEMNADNLTMVISIILVTAINYLIGKWIVFRKDRRDSGAPAKTRTGIDPTAAPAETDETDEVGQRPDQK